MKRFGLMTILGVVPAVDWPDIPGVPDLPGLPSPKDILEGFLEALSGGMGAEGMNAIKAIVNNLATIKVDFMQQWLHHLVSLTFGIAIVSSIMLALPIVVVNSMSTRMGAAERMVGVLTHCVKLLFIGYMTLPLYAFGFWVSSMLTKLFKGLASVDSASSDALVKLYDPSSLASVFGGLAVNSMIMISGGILYAVLLVIAKSLVFLAVLTPLFYTIKMLGTWGERFWKLFVSFVFACMFTTPFVVLIVGVASLMANAALGWNPLLKSLFLLFIVNLGLIIPLVIIVLSYVGYTFQTNKTKAEGNFKPMPAGTQDRMYNRQMMDRVGSMTSPYSNDMFMPWYSERAKPRGVMRGYIRDAAYSGVTDKLSGNANLVATKVASSGVPYAAAAAVVVKAGSVAVQRKVQQKQFKR